MGKKHTKLVSIYFLIAGLAALVALGYLLTIPGNSGRLVFFGISARWLVVASATIALLIAAGIAFTLAYFSFHQSSKIFQRTESLITRKPRGILLTSTIIFLLGILVNISADKLHIRLVIFVRLQPLLVWVVFVAILSALLCLVILFADRIRSLFTRLVAFTRTIRLKSIFFTIYNRLKSSILTIYNEIVSHFRLLSVRLKSTFFTVYNRLKSPILTTYNEIVSHFRLLSIDKKSVLEYFSSPYRIILIIIFSILFLPHAFVVVKDLSFVSAYEVDPGSIISSILSLYRNHYNMNAAYHSSHYGWTYYVISFIFLAPIYIAQQLKIIPNDYYFFLVGLRLIFFMTGLASVLVYFEIVKRIIKNTFLSFTAALLFIASPLVFHYFYFLHPESTGLLFSFLGVLCLLRFNDCKGEDHRWYTFGLTCLVLSALSKQVFLITALPILSLFYLLHCHYRNISIIKFALSKQFAKAFLFTFLFSLLIFFIIHPFAFIQYKVFIANQLKVIGISPNNAGGSSNNVINMQAITTWLEIIKSVPVIYLSLILTPITLLGAILFGRHQYVGKTFFIVNIICSILYLILISVSVKSFIQAGYFAPIYPFFILNFLSIPLYIVRKWNKIIIKLLIMVPLTYFLSYVLLSDFTATIPEGFTRLMYQNTDIYKVYNYIETNTPDGSRIAYDHFVALPSNKGLVGCHYWRGCGTDYIEEFKPDYVIFNVNYTFNGPYPPTERLKKYVADHHFILIDTVGLISIYKNAGPQRPEGYP